jgi:EAL domain-containing protein (putative c-di-GMP-specific phosphodiesterase class I)
VMRDALITRADWAQRRIVEESFRVHVNADPLAFASPTFARALLEKGLASNGCKPEWIGIEVIESDLLDRFDVSAKNIQTLREHGVTVSLDDFGTGYSTLNLLRALPVDQIKIDRSFVYNISVSDRDLSIARGIIRMAADLGIHVVAEGVETHEHLQVLRDLGCERGQGYLWGAASSAASFESLLIQQPTRTALP